MLYCSQLKILDPERRFGLVTPSSSMVSLWTPGDMMKQGTGLHSPQDKVYTTAVVQPFQLVRRVPDPGSNDISKKSVETAVIFNKYFCSTLLHLLPHESEKVFPIPFL